MNKLIVSALIFASFCGVAHAQGFIPIPAEMAMKSCLAEDDSYKQTSFCASYKLFIALYNKDQGNSETSAKDCVASNIEYNDSYNCHVNFKEADSEEKRLIAKINDGFIQIPIPSLAEATADEQKYNKKALFDRRIRIIFNKNQGNIATTTKECIAFKIAKSCVLRIEQINEFEKDIQAIEKEHPGTYSDPVPSNNEKRWQLLEHKNPGIFEHTGLFADDIPLDCADAGVDERINIPVILQLGNDSAEIVTITDLAGNQQKHMQYPEVNGAPARYFLFCPVKVEWSNGNIDYAYFEEWDDQYSSVQVYYGKEQYIPPYQ